MSEDTLNRNPSTTSSKPNPTLQGQVAEKAAAKAEERQIAAQA